MWHSFLFIDALRNRFLPITEQKFMLYKNLASIVPESTKMYGNGISVRDMFQINEIA